MQFRDCPLEIADLASCILHLASGWGGEIHDVLVLRNLIVNRKYGEESTRQFLAQKDFISRKPWISLGPRLDPLRMGTLSPRPVHLRDPRESRMGGPYPPPLRSSAPLHLTGWVGDPASFFEIRRDKSSIENRASDHPSALGFPRSVRFEPRNCPQIATLARSDGWVNAEPWR
jgi:hypothetical protein